MSEPARMVLGRIWADKESLPAPPPPLNAFGVLRSAWTIFQFEYRRSRTLGRMLIWLGVVLFPGLILMMMMLYGGPPPSEIKEIVISLLMVLVCEMVVLLNALLWVAPLVQAELEGKTWLYVAIRPFGRFALILGKGLNGFSWTLSAGLISLVVAVFLSTLGGLSKAVLMQNDGPATVLGSPGEMFTSVFVLAVLTTLSSLVYCPLFAAIGCIAPKRAMLIAFTYTLIFEVLVSWIPAVINRITVQYHLRCLLTKWFDFGLDPEGASFLFSEASPAWHVFCLLVMSLLWTAVALAVVHFRTYVATDEA